MARKIDPAWAEATTLKTAVVLGAPGSGKTTLVEQWIGDYMRRGGDVMILDPSAQFGDLGVWPEEGPEAFIINLKGNFHGLLVLDDADRYLSATPRGIWRDLFTSFRHWGVNLLVVSRRTQGIPKDVIASADDVIIFRLSEPHARKYLRGLVGEKATEAIPSKRYEFVKVSPFDPDSMQKGTTTKRKIETLADRAVTIGNEGGGDFWAEFWG